MTDKPWERSFVVVVPVENLHELADSFRLKAHQLRHDVRRRRFWPWMRDHKLIEAGVWEEAARTLDNAIILGNNDKY